MNWQFELETSGAYTLRVTVLDKVSAADIDILNVLAADDKLGSAKLDLGELKNTDAFEDEPLEFKTALRPLDPHWADVRGGGIALLFYARRGVEHGANKDEGDGGELLGQGGEACDGDSPSLFQRPAAPVDEVRGGHCRA